jgi:UbiD family decarboxylase
MNFPEIVDLALPAQGAFHILVFVGIKKTYSLQAYNKGFDATKKLPGEGFKRAWPPLIKMDRR